MEFLLVIPIVIVFVIFAALQSGARRSNLEAVARKFQGVVNTAWLSNSALEMSVDGVPAHLSYHAGSKNSSPYTRLRFKAPLGTRLRIVPEGFWESLKKTFGSEDLVLGDAGFDGAWVVQGYPASWVRGVMDAKARALVNRLAEFGRGFFAGPSVTIEAGGTGVLIAVPRSLVDDAGRLESFIQAAIDLFRAFRAPPDEGVKFVSAVELVAKGNCPVCEHPLGDSSRRCGTCATPHHGECWAYFGGCSTYACKENP